MKLLIKYLYTDGGFEFHDERSRIHRTDGPAVMWNDGSKEWYHHGSLHREDGPAIEGISGYEEYWVDGKRVYTT